MSDASISLNGINSLLKEKVTDLNAKLLLDSAVTEAGLSSDYEQPLADEDIKNVCLKLINKGGPSFHVGREVYKKYLQ